MAVLVAGLGISGKASLDFLLQQGDRLLAFDTSDKEAESLRLNYPMVNFAFGELPKSWVDQVQCVVLSPGIDPNVPWVQTLVNKGVTIVGEVELFCRAVSADKAVIAITGSNGKSTVTTLVGEILKAEGLNVAVGGNLGVPALRLLLSQPEADVYVLELSSFQIESTYSLHARSATVLNISPDHLDRYGEMAAYIAAKAPIYEMTDVAIVNRDDAMASSLCPLNIPKIGFGLSEPQIGELGVLSEQDMSYLAWWREGDEQATRLMPVGDLTLLGNHNVSNVLAAVALCLPLQVELKHLPSVLKNFHGLPHRTQLIATLQGVRWVNDSKGTNVGSTVSALKSLGGHAPIVLLAGGQGKGQDFSPLSHELVRYAKHLIVFGEDGYQIAKVCEGACPMSQVEGLEDAVHLANQLAVDGDVVLLSPACASFDQFKNYSHRGQVFIDLVNELSSCVG